MAWSLLCARAGLVGVNVVAIDGSKIFANASREATSDYERIAREILDEAQAVDAEEVKEAKRRLDEELWTEVQANAGYVRYRARGVSRYGRRLGLNTIPKPYTPPPVPHGQINTTDLDSRLVKGQHGWLQGHNAQAASNEDQIVVAAEIAVASPDFGHLAPMVTAARRESMPPASARRRRGCSPTPATGMPSRCTNSPPTASRS